MNKATNYPSEFKREAVKLAQSSDKPTSQIAGNLPVSQNNPKNN